MPAIICPLCRNPLAREDKTWRCGSGHAFDIAREGYVNLLPVQQKNSRAPGDNVDMVRARRDFLDAGHYAPLREAMVDILRPLGARTVLDIGCGEGWYTRALADLGPGTNIIGIDIAKPAVQLAAKRFPNITWLVGSSAVLPVADASVDLVTSLFSPLPAAEMARVLKPGGHLLVVTPAARHLWSLREALFDEVREHRPEKFIAELAPAFTLQERRDVAFPLQLDNKALRNLLLMTPYVWRAKPGKRAALEENDAFSTEAGFALLLLQRKDQPG
jgi:23S rRNA (guanine745-N1)-methyltransferase